MFPLKIGTMMIVQLNCDLYMKVLSMFPDNTKVFSMLGQWVANRYKNKDVPTHSTVFVSPF